jgi:hypothetical protein
MCQIKLEVETLLKLECPFKNFLNMTKYLKMVEVNHNQPHFKLLIIMLFLEAQISPFSGPFIYYKFKLYNF